MLAQPRFIGQCELRRDVVEMQVAVLAEAHEAAQGLGVVGSGTGPSRLAEKRDLGLKEVEATVLLAAVRFAGHGAGGTSMFRGSCLGKVGICARCAFGHGSVGEGVEVCHRFVLGLGNAGHAMACPG